MLNLKQYMKDYGEMLFTPMDPMLSVPWKFVSIVPVGFYNRLPHAIVL
jgi:hypothetical protein